MSVGLPSQHYPAPNGTKAVRQLDKMMHELKEKTGKVRYERCPHCDRPWRRVRVSR